MHVHCAGVNNLFLEFYAGHLHKLGKSLGDKHRESLDRALEEVVDQIFFENSGGPLGLIPLLISLGADPLQNGGERVVEMGYELRSQRDEPVTDEVLFEAQLFIYTTFFLFIQEREKLSDAAISELDTVAQTRKGRNRNRKNGRGGQQSSNQVSANSKSAENVTTNRANAKESNSVDVPDCTGCQDSTIRPSVPPADAGETSTIGRKGRHVEWLKSLPDGSEFEFQGVPSASAVATHGLLDDTGAATANQTTDESAAMFDRMKEQISEHPKALALDIQPQHLLGVDTNKLSDAQLEELEKLHVELMQQCIELRIQRARWQGFAAVEESMAVCVSSSPKRNEKGT